MRQTRSAAPPEPLVACAAALLLCASAAYAQDTGSGTDAERAAAAFEQGVARFQIGDHAAALVAFRTAHRLVPNPAVLYNVGQTCEVLGQHGAAYQALERYLSESTSVSASRRTAVLATLRRLRPQIAAVTVQLSPPDARISIDGAEAERLPPGGVVYLDPGPHRFDAATEGWLAGSVETRAEAGATATLRLELTRAPEPLPPPVAPAEVVPAPVAPPRAERAVRIAPPAHARAGGPPVISFALGGVALAAFATTAVAGAIALGAHGEIEDAATAVERGEEVSRAEVRAAASRGQTAANVADVALAVGIVSAGIAVVVAIASPRADDREPALAVRAGVSGASVSGRF